MATIIKKTKNRFFIGDSVENAVAEITFFRQSTNVIVIDHTFVSRYLRGKGNGAALVNTVVEYARQENVKIIPICPFAKEIMIGKKEYQDILM